MTRNTNNTSSTNTGHDEHFASLDAELRAVHAALDRDAAARAGEPDAEFERRVAVGSFGGMLANASEPTPVVAGRIGGGFVNARRLAAAIAILAAAGAAWVALKPSKITLPPDHHPIATGPNATTTGEDSTALAAGDSADDWIAIATTMDDGTGAEIDALFADTVRVESNLKNADGLLGGSVSMDGGGV